MPELQGAHRIGEYRVQRIGPGDVADPHRPAMAVERRARVFRIVLGAQEIGQHLGKRPAAVPRRRPIVIVLRMAAEIDHAVDRARAAQHAPARDRDAPAFQVLLRHRLQAPAQLLQRQRRADQRRHVDEGVAVLAPRLDQAHSILGIL